MRRLALLALVIAVAGCQTIDDPEDDENAPDDMCPALRTLAEAIPASQSRQVTLRTWWDAEPTSACGPTNSRPEKAFCNYLVRNTSIEFMSTNIRRVMSCAGISFPETPDDLYRMVGLASSQSPAFTQRAITLDLTFDTTSSQGTPYLTITLTPRQKAGQ